MREWRRDTRVHPMICIGAENTHADVMEHRGRAIKFQFNKGSRGNFDATAKFHFNGWEGGGGEEGEEGG